MQNFISVGEMFKSSRFDFINNRQTIECETHGKVEALLNGRCSACKQADIKKREKADMMEIVMKEKVKVVPEKYWGSNFDNYIPVNDKSERLLNFCKEFDFKSNLLLLGKTGNGKTHLACSMIERAILLKMTAYYVKYSKLVDLKIKDYPLFKRIVSSKFLVIDEYGRQGSDFKSDLFFEIIDDRYDSLNATMIISNLDEKVFSSSISAPVYSRLKENIVVRVCDWEDYRLKGSK